MELKPKQLEGQRKEAYDLIEPLLELKLKRPVKNRHYITDLIEPLLELKLGIFEFLFNRFFDLIEPLLELKPNTVYLWRYICFRLNRTTFGIETRVCGSE